MTSVIASFPDVTPSDLRPFVRLLEERIGLDAASIGHDEVGRAIRARLGRGAAPRRLSEYYRQVAEQGDEWDEFVEHVLVPETWFFREPSAFDLLVRVVDERLAAGRPCRILSVPCATGEEPYSIAIALNDAGLAAGSVTIDAGDISPRALQRAASGVYGARAVRYVGAERLVRHFSVVEEGHRVNSEIRAMVSFARGNLVDERLFVARARYDVIFCRNVLIYFTASARARVLAILDAALLDDGVLITGHAEGMTVVAPRFVSARVPRTFAYRKASTDERTVSAAPLPPNGKHAESTERTRPAPRPRTSQPARPVVASASAPDTAPAVPSLSEIERLADAGELTRALELCRRHIASVPGSSQGYYLLGVIETALGHEDASDAALRRAIYLDPGHVAALQHLASERRRRGDAKEAAQLARRATLVRARQP